MGAVIGGASSEQREALRVYGNNLGMAFQLVDDALDYVADQNVLGKEVGDDFREGKITLPVLVAYERGNEADRLFWRRVIEEGQQEAEDFDNAFQRMMTTDAIGVALAYAEDYAEKARKALQVFPDSVLKGLLYKAVDYSVKRKN